MRYIFRTNIPQLCLDCSTYRGPVPRPWVGVQIQHNLIGSWAVCQGPIPRRGIMMKVSPAPGPWDCLPGFQRRKGPWLLRQPTNPTFPTYSNAHPMYGLPQPPFSCPSTQEEWLSSNGLRSSDLPSTHCRWPLSAIKVRFISESLSSELTSRVSHEAGRIPWLRDGFLDAIVFAKTAT